MGIDIQFMSPYLYPIFRQRSAGSTLSFVVSEDEDTFGFPEDFSNTLHISPSECKLFIDNYYFKTCCVCIKNTISFLISRI